MLVEATNTGDRRRLMLPLDALIYRPDFAAIGAGAP